MRILFFDGYCTLCNGIVDWTIRHDKNAQIQFASLQGEAAKKIIPDCDTAKSDTVLYFRDDRVLERSDAILFLLSDIGGIWKMAKLFLIVPKFIRDFVYKIVAANRYRLFRKRESCRVPTESERHRLLL